MVPITCLFKYFFDTRWLPSVQIPFGRSHDVSFAHKIFFAFFILPIFCRFHWTSFFIFIHNTTHTLCKTNFFNSDPRSTWTMIKSWFIHVCESNDIRVSHSIKVCFIVFSILVIISAICPSAQFIWWNYYTIVLGKTLCRLWAIEQHALPSDYSVLLFFFFCLIDHTFSESCRNVKTNRLWKCRIFIDAIFTSSREIITRGLFLLLSLCFCLRLYERSVPSTEHFSWWKK